MRVCCVRILRVLVFGATLIGGSTALADDDHQLCLDAYDRAQRLKQTGALKASREQLLICGGPQCPTAMHADCERWLSEVESSLPTVVIEVDSQDQRPLKHIQVAIDGEAPKALDGRAIALDPGEHRVKVTAPGYISSSHVFLLSEGQKLRRESVTLRRVYKAATQREEEKLSPKSTVSARPHRNPLPWVISGAVAVLGAGGFTYWGMRARQKEEALDDCSPFCTQGRIEEVRHQYLYANVALGVGVVGAIAATVLYFVNPGKSQGSAQRAVQVGLCPGASGAAALFRF